MRSQGTERRPWRDTSRLAVAAALAAALCACSSEDEGVRELSTPRGGPTERAPGPGRQAGPTTRRSAPTPAYERQETRDLVALVDAAANKVEAEGERAFDELSQPGSRWRHGETYVFVLASDGTMLVHPDPALQGKNTIDLKDVNGRPIIRGLIRAATAVPDQPAGGWYHYEWPVPGGLQPRWKSSYVRQVEAPSGERYVIGAGMYDDRMERAFVVHMVKDAVQQIESRGEAAFPQLHDKTGPFFVKDAYVFVIDPQGKALVHPGHPNLEGRSLLDVKDPQGRTPIRDMLRVVETQGSGWVDYMWPKPGEGVSTQKSTYVSKARLGDSWVLVGSGVYLAGAPKTAPDPNKLTAPELMTLVREAAALFEQRGEQAYPELRQKGSKWFRDDTYFFVWKLDGTRTFHAADPALEGENGRSEKDVLGRPYGEFMIDAANSPSGEGWVHYMYPKPGGIFPTWKSAFVKRVDAPSGEAHLIGAGIYEMKMDRAFIEDVVDRAAALIEDQGEAAFDQLRDKQGPFVFMDTYVFVTRVDGIMEVNPNTPSLEGKDVMDLRDVNGEPFVREYIAAATQEGSAWTAYDWYKPGDNVPSPKQVYVRKVEVGPNTYIVGSGVYLEDERAK